MNTTTRLLIARHGNTFGPGDIIREVGTTDLSLVERSSARSKTRRYMLLLQG